MTTATHHLRRAWLDEPSGRIVITAAELREVGHRFETTPTGIQIGCRTSRVCREPGSVSGPHRARATLGDRAVAWACGVGALAVVVLLVVEGLA